MAIGQLDVKLALDTAEFSSGVNKATGSLSRFGSALANVAGIGIGTAIGSGITSALAGINKAFSESIDSIDKFKSAAADMGAAGQAVGLLALSKGISNLGVESKIAQEQVTTFSSALKDKMMAEATNATRALDKLGVSVTTSTGALRPQAEVMQDVINKFALYRDDAFKAAAAAELFGKNTAQNAELLTQTGTAALDAAKAAESSALAWAGLGAELDRLSQATNPVINALTTGLAGALTTSLAALEGLANALTGPVVGAFDTFANTADGAGSTVGSAMQTAGGVVVGALSAIISIIGTAINAFAQLASAAGSAAQAVISAWSAIGGAGAKVMSGDISGGWKDLQDGAKATETHVDNAAKSIAAFGQTVTTTVGRATTDAIDGFNKFNAAMDASTQRAKTLEMTVRKTGASIGKMPSIGSVGKPAGGGGGGGGGGKSEADKEREALERYAEAVKNAADPQRVFTAEMLKFNQALAAGLLTMDQYAVAVSMATKKMEAAAKSSGLATPMMDFKKGIKAWGDEVAGSLADAIVEGDNLNDVFKSLIKSLIKMALELLVLKPLMASISSGFSGLFGGGLGVMGAAMPMAAAAAPMSAFARGAAPPSALASGIVYPSRSTGRAAGPGGATKVTNHIGDISMSITPEGGSTMADSRQGQIWGERVRAIIQREMVMQSRPGGILRGAVP